MLHLLLEAYPALLASSGCAQSAAYPATPLRPSCSILLKPSSSVCGATMMPGRRRVLAVIKLRRLHVLVLVYLDVFSTEDVSFAGSPDSEGRRPALLRERICGLGIPKAVVPRACLCEMRGGESGPFWTLTSCQQYLSPCDFKSM